MRSTPERRVTIFAGALMASLVYGYFQVRVYFRGHLNFVQNIQFVFGQGFNEIGSI
jgi:hypothetical protein